MAIVVSQVKGGPIRVQIEAQNAALRLFSQSEQNTIVRTAVRAAGEVWVAVFLPKRFSTYANMLGYRVTNKWKDNKVSLARRGVIPGPQPTPMVYTGVMRATAIARARADGRATKSKAVAIIKIPFGHAVRPELTKVFKTIPKHEIVRMAQEVQRQLVLLIATGKATGKAKGPQRTIVGAASAVRGMN